MSIIIRNATLEDAATIIAFQRQMAKETEDLELAEETISAGVKAVFSDDSKGNYYVAADGNRLIGSFLITPEWSDWRNSYVWWFQSVYVLPEYRRMGVFTKMYDFTKSTALSSGIAGLRLYVEINNERARETYKSMGMNGEHYSLFEWLKDE